MINFYVEEGMRLPNLRKRLLKSWIKKIIENKGKYLGDIAYQFCSDETILKTNQDFLQHDYYTDVITFDDCQEDTINGDILISLDTVKSNSQQYGHPYDEELHRVIIHGILHLVGLGDKSPKEAQIMRQEEEKALAILYSMLNEKQTLLR